MIAQAATPASMRNALFILFPPMFKLVTSLHKSI